MAKPTKQPRPKQVTPEQAEFLEEIEKKYSLLLRYYIRRFLNYNGRAKDIEDDIVQEVLLKAVRDVDKLMAHENVVGWLKRSCEFSLRSTLRKMRNSREIPSDTVEKLEIKSEKELLKSFDNWSQNITVKEVREAVCELFKEEDQQVFNDYFGNDMTMKETAEKNGMTTDKVRGKISRIRKKLKKYFQLTCIFLACTLYIL